MAFNNATQKYGKRGNPKKQTRNDRTKDELVTKAQVRSMITSRLNYDEEDKQYSIFSSLGITSTGSFYDCNGQVTQGTSSSQRIGDEVINKSLDISCGFTYGDVTNFVRLLVFQWNMNDGADPVSMADLFQDITAPVYSFLTNYQPSRFKVLHDQVFALCSGGEGAVAHKIHIPINKRVSYVPGFNTGIHHVYFVMVSDSGASPNPTASIAYALNYTDS